MVGWGFFPSTVMRTDALLSKSTGFLRAYASISTRATVPLQVSCLPTTRTQNTWTNYATTPTVGY